jgi:hypothetical protein
VPVGLEVGFEVVLEEGGGGGAVGPVCDGGLLLAFGVFLGAGGLGGACEDVAGGGGGGRAVRPAGGLGGALFRLRPGVGPEDGGGGGVSTPMDRPADFDARWLVGVEIAAGRSDPPEEPGQANQMPAPAATSSVRPTRMGPRRS